MRDGTKHSVCLGKDGGTMKILGTVQGEANVVNPGGLNSNSKYTWRVDTVGRAGQLRKGPEWQFTTGSTKSCPPPPAPTPPTPKPTPPPTPAPAPTPLRSHSSPPFLDPAAQPHRPHRTLLRQQHSAQHAHL
jgi:hypothetical protein